MPRIPSYIHAVVSDIDGQDIILGEDVKGSGKTFVYTFDILKDYFGISNTTGVLSINGLTGVVKINTGDIPAISNYNYVTDNQLEVISRFVVDGNNMNLWDADAHLMTFVGKDDTHEVGLDMLNPVRFDIQVPPTVPTSKATFTLQHDRSDALSFIASDYRIIRFVTTTDQAKVEAWVPVHLKEVVDGDDQMESLVLDPVTGEIKKYDIAGSGLGATIREVISNVPTTGGIDPGDVFPVGTDLTTFMEELLTTVYDPTKTNNYVTLLGVTTITIEVGNTYNTTLVSSYYAGTIVSADGSPTIDLTGPATTTTFSGNGVDSGTGVVSWNIILGSNMWSVIQDYSIGVGSYYDSDSVESFIFDGDRVAGFSADNSNVVTGKNYLWWSVGSIETTSAGVRSLPDRIFSPVSSFDISIPQGEQLVAFYLPNNGFNTVTVLYIESSNADVTSTFTEVLMNVDDAQPAATAYTRFETTIPGIGYTADATYRVTVS